MWRIKSSGVMLALASSVPAPQAGPNKRQAIAVRIAIACRLLGPAWGAGTDDAKASITPEDLMRHIRTLASDEFEGRAPGTQGEQLTVRYVTDQFKRIGVKPGNPDGTFVQKVPLA